MLGSCVCPLFVAVGGRGSGAVLTCKLLLYVVKDEVHEGVVSLQGAGDCVRSSQLTPPR